MARGFIARRRRPWSALGHTPWPTQRRGRHSLNPRRTTTGTNEAIDRLLPWYEAAQLDDRAGFRRDG
jgi:hypothetical protein